MKWQSPLVAGKFVKRYKRFFADIALDDIVPNNIVGDIVTAHLANTGSLKGCLSEGARAWLLPNSDPSRKLKYSLQIIQDKLGNRIGVNTALPNLLVKEAILSGKFYEGRPLKKVQSEVKLNAETRLDFLLEFADGAKRYVEVKSVTYAEEDCALFPDAVTTRGQKHLKELMSLQAKGFETELVFVIQREGIRKFAPAVHIDPDYADLLKKAAAVGVQIRPVLVNFSQLELFLETDRKVHIPIVWSSP